MRVSSMPHCTACSGLAVSATTWPRGSTTPCSRIQSSTDCAFNRVSAVVKVLDAITSNVFSATKRSRTGSSAVPSIFDTTSRSYFSSPSLSAR